jgi:hypothetical protein
MEDALGRYSGDLEIACKRAGGVASVIAAVWFVIPFAVQTVLHPSDGAGLVYWLQGYGVPHSFSFATLIKSEIATLAALAVLSAVLFVALAMLYERAKFFVTLSPVAGISLGVVGNLVWWIETGHFDVAGALTGLAPLALTVIGEAVAEQLAADAVFGPGNRPRRGYGNA